MTDNKLDASVAPARRDLAAVIDSHRAPKITDTDRLNWLEAGYHSLHLVTYQKRECKTDGSRNGWVDAFAGWAVDFFEEAPTMRDAIDAAMTDASEAENERLR